MSIKWSVLLERAQGPHNLLLAPQMHVYFRIGLISFMWDATTGETWDDFKTRAEANGLEGQHFVNYWHAGW